MIDLIEMGRRLWESEAAEVADPAENQQPRGKQLAEALLKTAEAAAESAPLQQNQQHFSNPKITASPHGTGFSAESAGSAPANPAESEKPAPLADIDTIIHFLVEQVGRDLGPDLDRRMRRVMAPMDRKGRAEIAAALDDAFEVAGSVEAARWQCHRLLTDAKTLEAAKAVWPGLPTASTPAPDRPINRPVVDHTPRWLRLIREQCPLVDGDTEFVGKVLARLAPMEQEQAARRYVAAWQAAAEGETQPSRKANAGRQAANQTLLPAHGRPMATGSTRQPSTTTEAPSLPAGVRMSWTIRVDDKRLVLAGTAYTREQAQQAAQVRWPDADVEVVE